MSKRRFVTMVGGTVACALGIGFFMQRGETASPRNLLAPLPSPIQQMVLKPTGAVFDADDTVSMTYQTVSLTSVLLTSAVPQLPGPNPQDSGLNTNTSQPLTQAPTAPSDPAMPQLGCAVTATATPGPMASVDLAVSAPCFENERVTIHHNGMMFTEVTDPSGQLMVTIPALAERAVFMIAFADGLGTVALTNVPTLRDYDRVVVQWTGNSGFQIHAREFGAAYGDAGHVWSGMPQSMLDNGGLVTRLGEADTLVPQLAEVYTFPTGATDRTGTVALSIEAEVTADNCGRDVSAQSLELRSNQSLRARDLVLSVPKCAAMGDFLVLNNLVDNMTIAAN